MDLNSALFIAGLVYVTACAVLFFRWLDANVPLSSRRQATLERRSLDDYVPRPLQYAIYAVIGLHLAAWMVVGVTGRYATAAFSGAMAFQFVISGVFLLFVVTAVRRRPAAMDRILGRAYRRTGVRLAVAAQLLPLPNGIARLYEQVAGTSSVPWFIRELRGKRASSHELLCSAKLPVLKLRHVHGHLA